MAKPRIFISMGTPYNEKYRKIRDEVENFLKDGCDVEPVILGKSAFSLGNPLNTIRDIMRKCDGVIVIAYERNFVEDGFEKRDCATPIKIKSHKYTTAWNHIETAMAFAFGIPLYIICEEGLKEDGLIETKSDWYVEKVSFESPIFSEVRISHAVKNWVDARVGSHSRKPKLIKALLGSISISELSLAEIAAIFGILGTAVGLGATMATLLPKLFN